MNQFSKSTRLIDFFMSPIEARILSAALDFAIFSDDHSSIGNSFCHSSYFTAAEKIDAKDFHFTKQELRSIAFAINYSLQHIFDKSDRNAFVEDNVPGIIEEIQESHQLLAPVRVRISAVLAKASHRK